MWKQPRTCRLEGAHCSNECGAGTALHKGGTQSYGSYHANVRATKQVSRLSVWARNALSHGDSSVGHISSSCGRLNNPLVRSRQPTNCLGKGIWAQKAHLPARFVTGLGFLIAHRVAGAEQNPLDFAKNTLYAADRLLSVLHRDGRRLALARATTRMDD